MTHRRLAFHNWPAAVYAIGDVHGCLAQLQALEAIIAEDGKAIPGEKWLVTLGDHIDRGPDSAGVISHVMGPAPEGFERFSLLGNHEAIMLDFLGNPEAHAYWLDEGGLETLASYNHGTSLNDDPTATHWIPEAHLDFMAELPIYLSLPGWLFVHAGIRPGLPLSEQTDEDLIWIRAPFLTSQLTGGLRVVHGHTPSPDIVVTPHRIGVDTQCFQSGKLSAVRVMPDGSTKFFSVEN
jgi:serine/threonine protein phosphatase 1